MTETETVLMKALPEALLQEFSGFVSRRMCLHFPRERWPELARGARSAAQAFGHADTARFLRWLLRTELKAEQIDELASHLTVGETYFFRGRPSFDVLESRVLPELVRARRGVDQRLRIWSAGCCTGEEAYSLAILLSRVIPDLENWHVTIRATDINRHFLRKAERGIYGPWSFRDAPPWLRDFYFQPRGEGLYEVVSSVRRLVGFAPLNLAADVYPSLLNDTNAMDLILCRNVLMYFAPEYMAAVVQKLHHCLVEGGWLVVGPNEVSQTLFAQFEAVCHPEATLYRRRRTAGAKSRETQRIAPVRAAHGPAAGPDAEAALESARALYREGDYSEAIELLAARPAEPGALMLLARASANQGRLADALAWCDKAVAAAGLDPAGHFLRANILHERGDLEEAARAYQRALYLDPDFALAHFALGNVSNERGRPDEARRHFRHALHVLRAQHQDHILPESEGVTAGRLAEIISGLLAPEAAHGS